MSISSKELLAKIDAEPGLYPDPAHPQKLNPNKRVRVARCPEKLRLPAPSGRAEITMQCQHEKHADGPHKHEGVVLMGNNTVRKFSVTWLDMGELQPYQQAKRSAAARRKELHK